MEAGYTKPVAVISVTAKAELITTLSLHYTLLRSKAELDQLRGGLFALEVLDNMKKYPSLLEPWFVAGKTAPLTAGYYYFYISITNFVSG